MRLPTACTGAVRAVAGTGVVGAVAGTGVVRAVVVRAEDAPGPTLVVRLDRLPPGALGLAEELAHVRHALAPTPYTALNKIALYGPSTRPSGASPGTGTGHGPSPGPGHCPAALDYRFVQALLDGRFDFRAGCGHSLLAAVVADGRPGPVTVRAVTTGDTVLCTPEGDGAYTLDFLRAPTAPGTLPTGRPVDVLDGVPVSLVRYGNPYVLVDARLLPAHRLRERLLDLRARAGRLLGYAPHSPLPKIAAFDRSPHGLLVRALTVGGWHPRLALTGAAALAAAGAIDGTVVPGPVGLIRTPGGDVTVSATPDRVRVHHKRARILGELEVTWRIHATA